MPYIYKKSNGAYCFNLKPVKDGGEKVGPFCSIEAAVAEMRHLTKTYCMVYPSFLEKGRYHKAGDGYFPKGARPVTYHETELFRAEWSRQNR